MAMRWWRSVGHRMPPIATFPGRLMSSTSSKSGGEKGRDLPDFNTSVDINSHRLTRPSAPPPPVTHAAYLATLEKSTKGSLIPETLHEMENDEEFQLTAKRLREVGQRQLTKEEKKRTRRELGLLGIPDFNAFLEKQRRLEFGEGSEGVEGAAMVLQRRPAEVLQINVGIYCNQACTHCHVESSPTRKEEMMTDSTAERCIEVLAASPSVTTVDLTGGAP